MGNSKHRNDKIREYWNGASDIYHTYMDQEGHQNIHYGFCDVDDESVEDTESTTNKMNEYLAEKADIGPGDRVLHCGCGYGGPAIWTAKNRDAEAIGINIVEEQLEQARENARREGVEEQTDFRYDDLTEMDTIDDGEIDVIWVIEAVIYAENKTDFIEQARRVLGEDGRFVIAEGFKAARDLSSNERRLLRNLREGWHVPNFAHIDDFVSEMRAHGFEDVAVDDVTANIEAFSKWQYLGKHYEYGLKLVGATGLMKREKVNHLLNQNYQYKVVDEGLMTYNVVSARV